MLKNIIIFLISIFLLCGCADNFRGYFKKSANNKYVDAKGFHGGKRKPLYNKKYISKAKRNIIEANIDEDEEEFDSDDLYETYTPSRLNKQMYMEMIEEDAMRQKRQRLENYKGRYNDRYEHERQYPSLREANNKAAKQNIDDQQLQRELTEIKSMLNEAKNNLAKYRCPMQAEIDRKPTRSPSTKTSEEVNNRSLKKEKYIQEEDDYKEINSEGSKNNYLAPHSI